ncbi:MAG: glycosyltransferase family 2 protein [Thermoanaerobaculia bacterium]
MISAVFVSYRSAELAAAAIDSFRAGARSSGRRAEVVVVVNSEDPAERDVLEPCSDVLIFPPRNLGFAGGLNAGVAAARGETLFLSNPDLRFAEGAVGALADAVEKGGLLAAGPALFADGARTILMPPAEEARPEELARRALAADPARSARAFRREARRAASRAEHAEAGRSLEVRGLSGALVVASRRTFEDVGPFDERYRLYYEENDWQRRLLRKGGRLVFVGGAHVVHLYGQSTRKEPRAEEWFRESERRYFVEHFGGAGLAGLARLASLGAPPWPPIPIVPSLEWEDPAGAAVAVSPYRQFRPFGLVLVPTGTRRWELPSDFADARSGETLFARAFVRQNGETLAEGRFEPA